MPTLKHLRFEQKHGSILTNKVKMVPSWTGKLIDNGVTFLND